MQELLEFKRSLKLFCLEHAYEKNCYVYTINISFIIEGNSIVQKIDKTKKQFIELHELLNNYIFELEQPFQAKFMSKQQAHETKTAINIYLSHLQNRLDFLTSKYFLSFFDMENKYPALNKIISKEFLDKLAEINIHTIKQQVIDFAWQSKEKVLFVVSESTKEKKITNFFKSLLSKETNNGTLQIIQYSDQSSKWNKIIIQTIEAKPIKVTWNRKSSTLIISTGIGLYVYMIGFNNKKINLTLIDFLQMPGIESIYCDSYIGAIYILSNGINHKEKSRLHSYSIKKQSTVQIFVDLNHATSMIFQNTNRRLYISDNDGIKIFKIRDDSKKVIVQNFKFIQLLKTEQNFSELALSREQKPQYLFGYNSMGFISVFQIKPEGKQHLMSILTNIECPSDYTFITPLWAYKWFCVGFGYRLCLISMKNEPLWVGTNENKQRIKKTIFDEQNQRLLYCDNNTLVICKVQI